MDREEGSGIRRECNLLDMAFDLIAQEEALKAMLELTFAQRVMLDQIQRDFDYILTQF